MNRITAIRLRFFGISCVFLGMMVTGFGIEGKAWLAGWAQYSVPLMAVGTFGWLMSLNATALAWTLFHRRAAARTKPGPGKLGTTRPGTGR